MNSVIASLLLLSFMLQGIIQELWGQMNDIKNNYQVQTLTANSWSLIIKNWRIIQCVICWNKYEQLIFDPLLLDEYISTHYQIIRKIEIDKWNCENLILKSTRRTKIKDINAINKVRSQKTSKGGLVDKKPCA